MEKTQKISAQIYGYLICLVAVITLLITITTLVNSLFDLQDPLHSGWQQPGSPSLASYENYKMDLLKSSQKGEGATQSAYVPDEKTMTAMFESAKADKIQSVKHGAQKSITISFLLIVICSILFVTHWRWLRKINKPEI
jgi:hypothetical protein